jgi:hypothetical protein
MLVKLSFEERVDGGVDVEGKAPRPPDAETLVEIEAARAIVEQLQATPREFERLFGGGIEESLGHWEPTFS